MAAMERLHDSEMDRPCSIAVPCARAGAAFRIHADSRPGARAGSGSGTWLAFASSGDRLADERGVGKEFRPTQTKPRDPRAGGR